MNYSRIQIALFQSPIPLLVLQLLTYLLLSLRLLDFIRVEDHHIHWEFCQLNKMDGSMDYLISVGKGQLILLVPGFDI